MKKSFYFLFAITLMIGAFSCEDDDDATFINRDEVIADYANIVLHNYEAARADAVDLKAAVDAFVAAPSAATQDAAKSAWLKARESYGPTEAYRFANGPIDGDIDGEEGPEGLLNSWPLDEAYIDYTASNPTAGIINDPGNFPTINKSIISDLNGAGGEENVSVGYHAIEFLLWGQDLTDPSAREAGKRSYTDYLDDGSAPNADRRRQYLRVTADLLVDHLDILIDQWRTGGDYRQTFLNLDNDVALSNMMTAIATLAKSELAGERMYVAYDNRDQEDEHSCFSDNTHRDIRLNFEGIWDVYYARDVDGSKKNSIADLVSEADVSLGAEIRDQFVETKQAIDATLTPFDAAITDEAARPQVLAAVNALRTLGDKIVEGGNAIGVEVRIE